MTPALLEHLKREGAVVGQLLSEAHAREECATLMLEVHQETVGRLKKRRAAIVLLIRTAEEELGLPSTLVEAGAGTGPTVCASVSATFPSTAHPWPPEPLSPPLLPGHPKGCVCTDCGQAWQRANA